MHNESFQIQMKSGWRLLILPLGKHAKTSLNLSCFTFQAFRNHPHSCSGSSWLLPFPANTHGFSLSPLLHPWCFSGYDASPASQSFKLLINFLISLKAEFYRAHSTLHATSRTALSPLCASMVHHLLPSPQLWDPQRQECIWAPGPTAVPQTQLIHSGAGSQTHIWCRSHSVPFKL